MKTHHFLALLYLIVLVGCHRADGSRPDGAATDHGPRVVEKADPFPMPACRDGTDACRYGFYARGCHLGYAPSCCAALDTAERLARKGSPPARVPSNPCTAAAREWYDMDTVARRNTGRGLQPFVESEVRP